jgi:hypothetical protein
MFSLLCGPPNDTLHQVRGSLHTNGHNLTLSPGTSLRLTGTNQRGDLTLLGGGDIQVNPSTRLFVLLESATFSANRVVVAEGVNVLPIGGVEPVVWTVHPSHSIIKRGSIAQHSDRMFQ